MFLHKYEPKYNLYLNICSNINKIKKRFKKELRNQSLKYGFDYVAPFLKILFFSKFCYDEVLTLIYSTYSMAKWLERNVSTIESWVQIY